MMRHTAALIATAVIAFLIIQSSARPCNDDAEYVSASQMKKSIKSASSSADQCTEQVQANSCTGEVSKSLTKSSSKTASASEDISSESYVAYKSGAGPCDDSLPARKSGECDEAYYKRIFPVNECDEASVKAFYAKVFKQYKGECDEEYVKRIDAVFVVYKTLDCRTNTQYVQYLEKYYVIKYGKKEGESDEEYFKRTITKTTETEEVYTNKITILKKFITEVDWTKVTVVYSSRSGYTLVKTTSASTGKSVDSSSSSCSSKTLTEEEVKKIYAKKEKETEEEYFKRIVTKTSTSITIEEYVKSITLIRKSFPSLELWYEKKYLGLVKEYYTAVYTKKTTESEEEYYKRIVTKESYESEEQCAKRVEVVRELFPNLSLWSEERFYVKYTKKVYSVVYKKYECEDDTTYYKRIVLRSEKESESVYVGRVTLIQRTFSCLSLWSCEKTLTTVKQFYSLKYAKRSGECDEDYAKRLTVKECWETSDEVYVQRVHLVHLVTVCSTVWYEDQYYKYTKVYYSLYYKKGDKEACVAWLTRVITLLPGESEETAIKRITLINKSKTGCGCWTVQNISKLECIKSLSKKYLLKVKKTFVKVVSSKVTPICQGLVTIVKRGNKG